MPITVALGVAPEAQVLGTTVSQVVAQVVRERHRGLMRYFWNLRVDCGILLATAIGRLLCFVGGYY